METDKKTLVQLVQEDPQGANTIILCHQAMSQARIANAGELQAAAKAAKNCVQIVDNGGYDNLITHTDCENLIKRFLERAENNNNS